MLRKSVFWIALTVAALLGDSGAGLKWTPPTSWKASAQRPMRLATYAASPAAGDSDPGECAVYYFGQGQGGSVEANMDRWIGQFQQAGGKLSTAAAKRETRTIHGLKVTTVDVAGAYTGMGGPMAPGGPAKPGYRMLAAIVEGPQGSIFFKFTGPAKTVGQNQAAFEKMLSSVIPG